MTASGVYKLQCWSCSKDVQLPAVGGALYGCPHCGAALTIQWNAARAEFDRAPREAAGHQQGNRT